ncbi:hypothetical protein L1049_003873 [Liquidambar formosana]|uniref:Uncharacterized protein n=1 Tax=Liquidambar formosana TaxID=63359 RepID=A0AAP0RQY7_LIQFO
MQVMVPHCYYDHGVCTEQSLLYLCLEGSKQKNKCWWEVGPIHQLRGTFFNDVQHLYMPVELLVSVLKFPVDPDTQVWYLCYQLYKMFDCGYKSQFIDGEREKFVRLEELDSSLSMSPDRGGMNRCGFNLEGFRPAHST